MVNVLRHAPSGCNHGDVALGRGVAGEIQALGLASTTHTGAVITGYFPTGAAGGTLS